MKIFSEQVRSCRARSWVQFLVLASVAGFLAACAQPAIKTYPDFNQQKQGVNTITVLCDYNVVYDVKGKKDLADVPKNLAAAKTAMDALDAQLAAKGYKIVRKDVVSMGLVAKPTESFKVAVDQSPANPDEIGKLPDGLPPFYVNRTLYDTDGKVEALRTVMTKLAEYTRKPGQPATKVPEALPLRTEANEDAILFLFMSGRDVPLEKSLLESAATSLLSLGTFTAYHTSYVQGIIYIVDMKSGEVIWSDGAAGQEMSPSSPKTHSWLFKAVTKGIPAK